MDGDICFKSASTEIQPYLREVLNVATKKILGNKKDYRMVIVEGHTDSDQIPEKLQKIYPSNWELSAARASNVVNYLIGQGVNSGRLQASGYADRWPAEASWYDVRSGKITDSAIMEYNSMRENRGFLVESPLSMGSKTIYSFTLRDPLKDPFYSINE